ncbi:MAG: DUF6519 domain-containing protein [Pseudomonadota bacterium]
MSRPPERSAAPRTGTWQQQGRMLTDFDWNAQSDLARARLADALGDIIGGGTPDRGGAMVEDAPGDWRLVLGTVYAEGVRGQLRAFPEAPAGSAFAFDAQADFPAAPPLPEEPYLLYVDLWERTVTALEDIALIDPGLHGADTTARSEVMAQVKWAPASFDPEDPAQNPPIGTAPVTISLRGDLLSTDPCEPCADEIELPERVGNYLFRLEVHDVTYDAAGQAVGATLKWSRENGAEAAAVGILPPGFASADWTYDFYHGAPRRAESERHLGYHHPDVLAAGWSPTRSALMHGYPETPPPDFTLVRRWDGHVELVRDGTAWRVVFDTVDGEPVHRGFDRGQRLSPLRAATEHGFVAEGASITLALDTTTVVVNLADNAVLAGDYWQVAVREAVQSSGDEILTEALPIGIRHRYLSLAIVDGDLLPVETEDCRRFEFPPLTDIEAEDVCYDNAACEMPGVETVQDAIDHLCRSRDLRFHNKHLHGWGIVCGLIVECDRPDEEAGEEEVDNREVTVTKGYALTCEGDDIVLEEDVDVELMDLVEAHDAAVADGTAEEVAEPILVNGRGTACLVLDLAAGEPVFTVEKDQPAENDLSVLLRQGTLWGDFWENCIQRLIDALTAEFSFVSGDNLDALEDDPEEPLVSTDRKKWISVLNLAWQLLNRANGAYVYLSFKEHVILRTLYTNLRELLASHTFCALFEGQDFPDYVFPDAAKTTFFGRNEHTRVVVSPDGRRVYTWAGGDRTINVYDAEKGVLIEVLEMPSAEGSEVTAIALNAAGTRLYAVASIGGADSIFAIARVGDRHEWEGNSIVLCDLTIREMHVDRLNEDFIYAVGIGRGLFLLSPPILRDTTEAKPEPIHAFNATGHMAVDTRTGWIFSTASTFDNDGTPDRYNVINATWMRNPENRTNFRLVDVEERTRLGSDGLTLREAEESRGTTRLFVAVDPIGTGDDKHILALDFILGDEPAIASAMLAVEDTQIALAFHPGRDQVVAAFEDSYRLMTADPATLDVDSFRIPAQIQPTDVAVGPEGVTYAVNLVSNTVTAIPEAEMQVDDAHLTTLASYRLQVLLAFYGLFGGVLQYLKDCFCHQLLIKCPECDGSEKIRLAGIEIRDNAVYNVCNFSKRKYVKSFPTVDYWLSALPIAPLIQKAVSDFCCAVLPNVLAKYTQRVVPPPPPPQEGALTGSTKAVRAKAVSRTIQTGKTVDLQRFTDERVRAVQTYGTLAGDIFTDVQTPTSGANPGVPKQTFGNAPIQDTIAAFERNNVRVNVVPYDPALSDRIAIDYARTPGRILPGSAITVYERDGRTVLVAEQRAAPAFEVAPGTEEKIAELEARQAALSDTLAAEQQIAVLQERRASVEGEVADLRGELDGLRRAREAEALELQALAERRTQLSRDFEGLQASMARMNEMQNELRVAVDRQRPVIDADEVTPEIAEALNTAGVRTLGELSVADERELRQRGVRLPQNELRLLIEGAQNRLR